MNPISPHYIYECIKRIFSRKSHDCLSSENKPKVAEVILKFARLYDGIDFSDPQAFRRYFDSHLTIQFFNFTTRPPLRSSALNSIVDSLNSTPSNFLPPSEEVLQEIIKTVDGQIAVDKEERKEEVLSAEVLDREVEVIMDYIRRDREGFGKVFREGEERSCEPAGYINV